MKQKNSRSVSPIVCLMIALFSVPALSQAEPEPKLVVRVKSIHEEPFTEPESFTGKPTPSPSPMDGGDPFEDPETGASDEPMPSDGSDPLAIADLIFRILDFVKDNKPVQSVDSKPFSALPKGASGDMMKLTGWLPVTVITFGITAENLFGSPVEFEYQVKVLAGGSLNKKGSYIAFAKAQPIKIQVGWGYTFDAQVSVPYVVNAGTAKDPVASMMLDVTYQISSWVKSYTQSDSFEIRGNGLIRDAKKNVVLVQAKTRK